MYYGKPHTSGACTSSHLKELTLIKIIWRISNASFCTTHNQCWLPFHLQ